MNIDAMFSSKTDLWATPQDFYEKLNADFGFTLDPCATPENAKCAKFYTKEQDGLRQNWGGGNCLLQSAIRQGDLRLGTQMLRRSAETQNNGCNADSSTH